MAFDFHTYLKAKDNFCFCYNGNYKEFIWQLLHVRKYAENQFPNIKIFISCIPEIANTFQEERIISANDLKNHLFLRTEEISFNMIDNPILKIAKDSNIKIPFIENKITGRKCHIIKKTKIPFKSYDELNKLENHILKNFDIVSLEEADVLFAVECEELYKWAFLGKKTFLISTENNGTYKFLFPGCEILNVNHI